MPSRPSNSRRPSSSRSSQRGNQGNNNPRGGNNRVGNSRNGIRSSGASASTRRRSAKQAPAAKGRIPAWAWIILVLIIGVLLGKHFFGSSQSNAPKPGNAAIVTRPTSALESDSNDQMKDQSKGDDGQSKDGTTKMPTFEFYTLLPESEVISPNVPNGQTETSTNPQTPAQTSNNSNSSASNSSNKSSSSSNQSQNSNANQSQRNSSQNNTRQQTASTSSSSQSTSLGSARYMLQAASFQRRSDAQAMANRFTKLGLTMQVTQVQTSDGSTWFRVQSGPYSDSNSLSKARGVMQSNSINPLIIRQR